MSNKILFVDDEQTLLNGIERRLGFEYDLMTADSGALGLSILSEHGPFAAVVTDMRMPGMDGLEFVKNARQVSPDSVYLMLTGNQDQATASQAVNEGQVFRFLNKPCDSDALCRALDAAVRQHELVTGEKELLRQTFCGAVGVLTDILEGTHAEFFGCSSSIEEIVAKVRANLHVEDHWEIRLASKLCLIGFALMPEIERESFLRAKCFDEAWLRTLREATIIGKRLIQKIPRLESVSRIIGGMAKSDGATPWLPLEEQYEIESCGSVLLRVAIHADSLASCGAEAMEGIQEIRETLPSMSIELEDALAEAWPDTGSQPITEVSVSNLAEDMVLAEDVIRSDGAVLVRQGRRLTTTIIEKLLCHRDQVNDTQTLRVYERSEVLAKQPALV